MDALQHPVSWSKMWNLVSTVKQIEEGLKAKKLLSPLDTSLVPHEVWSLPTILLTDRGRKKFRRLCNRLIQHTKSTEPSVREHATIEIIRLSISIADTNFFTFGMRNFEDRHICELWLRVLKDRSYGAEDIIDNYEYASLKESLRLDTHSTVAVHYLSRALKLPLLGNSLYILVKLWHCYLDFFVQVSENPVGKADWSTLDACIGNLQSGPLRIAFLPPDRLFNLIKFLTELGKEATVPNLFENFFRRPTLVYKRKGAPRKNSRSLITFERMSIEQEQFCLLHRYLLSCRVSGRLFDFEKVFDALEPYIFGRGGAGANDVWKYYCEVMKHVAIYYSRGLVRNTHDVITNTPEVREFIRIGRHILDSNFETSDNKAFAAFLVESFAANDFYCEDTLKKESPEFFDYFDHSPSRSAEIRKISGTSRLPLFDNVPYLRRFRVNDQIYITSDYLPKPNNICGYLAGLTVDTMALTGDLVYWLLHKSQSIFEPRPNNEELPLDLDGHFPVQAGEDSYIAAVKVEHIYYFTCVKNGASYAVYMDELGNERYSHEFFVLVLRHRDPELTPKWREFWPKRDPLYCAKSDAAKLDDEHLESCLTELQKFDHESELWKTIGF